MLIHIPGDTRIHISRDMVLPKAPYMLAKNWQQHTWLDMKQDIN